MVTKNILIILTAQDPKHIEPHNALPAFPRQDPLVEKKTYYTELANQVVSKVRLLKYGSEEKGSSLCKRSILLGFFMSKKLERLCSELLSEDKITNLLCFLT